MPQCLELVGRTVPGHVLSLRACRSHVGLPHSVAVGRTQQRLLRVNVVIFLLFTLAHMVATYSMHGRGDTLNHQQLPRQNVPPSHIRRLPF